MDLVDLARLSERVGLDLVAWLSRITKSSKWMWLSWLSPTKSSKSDAAVLTYKYCFELQKSQWVGFDLPNWLKKLSQAKSTNYKSILIHSVWLCKKYYSGH